MTDAPALAQASRFATAAPAVDARRFGSGHVNATYLITDAGGRRYVLQRINTFAFRHPAHVMENIVKVTSAMAAQIPDPRRRLTLVPTRDGAWWTTAGDDWWRLYDFIPDSTELAEPVAAEEYALVGRAFGEFLVQMAAVDAAELHVTIPHYHDEWLYMAKLKAVVAADPRGRVAEMAADIERVLAFEEVSHAFERTTMPLRVTHNDAKLSNVLVDVTTRQPLCVVDLDTVQPGYAANDFGDIIRSCATTAPESEPDATRVRFAPERFEACVRGYLGACGTVLEPSEIANLAQGARLMTLETSLRFLIDYLEGDLFYHIDYPVQNRDRARNQAALLTDLDRHYDAMCAVIAGIAS
ncbi:MAG: aminoglycoside phosphotransferase family protein [Propionibacteriaceae bacterium]|nr:aminoglycoside phosphotransferase family protein [Propionibacteriaceae bacterium]